MSELKVISMTVGVAATNCYFIYRDDGEEPSAGHQVHGIFFDPADAGDRIYETLTENGLVVDKILLTHAHVDHIAGADELRKRSGAKIYCHKDEEIVCKDTSYNVSRDFGRPMTIDVDGFLDDDEIVEVADMKCRVIATPGHTPGGCCYYFEDDALLVSGDTLFCQSVGRTDFPGGSMSTLIRSIREKLLTLPDDTEVLPGHMGPTTIGTEKKYNPFL